MTSKAAQIPTLDPDATKNAAVCFHRKLTAGSLLTGTPTVTATPDGLTISNERVSDVDIEEDGETVLAGQAVFFTVSGTAGSYTIKAVCGTDSSPAETLAARCTLRIA